MIDNGFDLTANEKREWRRGSDDRPRLRYREWRRCFDAGQKAAAGPTYAFELARYPHIDAVLSAMGTGTS